MRHFQKIVQAHYQSYQINAGEYESSVNVEDVLKGLACAMRIPLKSVYVQYEFIIKNEENRILCPSECEVLESLAQFCQLVRNCEYDYWAPSSRGCHVFQYHNLNDGLSVVWVHSVF